MIETCIVQTVVTQHEELIPNTLHTMKYVQWVPKVLLYLNSNRQLLLLKTDFGHKLFFLNSKLTNYKIKMLLTCTLHMHINLLVITKDILNTILQNSDTSIMQNNVLLCILLVNVVYISKNFECRTFS